MFEIPTEILLLRRVRSVKGGTHKREGIQGKSTCEIQLHIFQVTQTIIFVAYMRRTG